LAAERQGDRMNVNESEDYEEAIQNGLEAN
jgi:hypothetical protein